MKGKGDVANTTGNSVLSMPGPKTWILTPFPLKETKVSLENCYYKKCSEKVMGESNYDAQVIYKDFHQSNLSNLIDSILINYKPLKKQEIMISYTLISKESFHLCYRIILTTSRKWGLHIQSSRSRQKIVAPENKCWLQVKAIKTRK